MNRELNELVTTDNWQAIVSWCAAPYGSARPRSGADSIKETGRPVSIGALKLGSNFH